MPPIRDEGVCVRQWDWSETSQTACVLTRDHGLVRCLAKGSKRERAPYSGGLEVLARADLVWLPKPAGQLALLTAWDLAETYPRCRAELDRFYAGLCLADLVGQAVQDHDPHPGLYAALVDALRAIGSPDADPGREPMVRALLGFLWTLLVETGHRPELDRDAGSGEDLATRTTMGFSPDLGGVVPDPGPGGSTRAWRVRRETIELLRRVATSGSPPPVTPTDALERGARLLASYAAHRLEVDLPTLDLVFGRASG